MAWVKGEFPMVIFDGGDDGGLYARAVPGKSTYHHTFNWDCRAKGSSSPSMGPRRVFAGGSTSPTRKPITSFLEWEDSSGKPYLLYATGAGTVDANVITATDGVAARENQTADPYLRAVKYRNDVGGGGVDTPVVWLCNGASNDGIYSRLADGTTTNAAHTQKADGLAVVGGDLWSWDGYKAQKCTTDSDPGVTGSWRTPIPVGIPDYDINEMINLGNSPIVLKGEGIYAYNPQTAEFELLTPAITPHADNGKGGFTDGRGRVYYPTVDGDIIVQTFGFQSQQKPTRTTTIDRDTPFGRITHMTADMEHVYAVTEPGTNRVFSGMGMVVKSVDGGAFTTHSDIGDSRFGTATDADWSALTGTGDADFIYFGADVPFWGAYIGVSSSRTTLSLLRIRYSDGAGGWIPLTDDRYDSTMCLDHDGLIVPAFFDMRDIVQDKTWLKNTVDSVEKYWIRLQPSTTVDLTGSLVYQVGLVPYRPPLDVDVFPATGYEVAGALPKILVGTWQGEEIKWDDVWTLEDGRVEKLLVARDTHAVDEAIAGGRRALFAITADSLFALPIGADSQPQRVPWPKLADYSETGVVFDTHAIWFSGHDSFVHKRATKKVLAGTVIDFPHVQSDDDVYVYHWWDSDASRVYKNQIKGSHAVLRKLEGEGRVLYMALQFVDGSRDEVAPQLLSVEVPNWEWNDDPGHEPPLKEDQAQPIQR